jgi:hypothetical protein
MDPGLRRDDRYARFILSAAWAAASLAIGTR